MLQVMTADWIPSDAVYQQLGQLMVPTEFTQAQLPEFILYWMERGEKSHAWGSKFLKHCIREWRQHEIQAARGEILCAMTVAWQPSSFTLQTLEHEGITHAFSLSVLADFIIYWRDRGEVCSTWNSKFMQHVRYKAAHLQTVSSTRKRGLTDDLNDTSWAKTYLESPKGFIEHE